MKRFFKKLLKISLIGFFVLLGVLTILYTVFSYQASREIQRIHTLLQQSPVHQEVQRLMNLKKIPDDENAATYYKKANTLFSMTTPFPFYQNSFSLRDWEKFIHGTLIGPGASQTIREVRQELSDKLVQDGFQLIEKASSLKICRYNLDYNVKILISMEIPYLLEIPQIMRPLLIQPYMDLIDKHDLTTPYNLVYALKVSPCLLQNHSVIDEMIYSSSRQEVFDFLQEYFNQFPGFADTSSPEKKSYLHTLLSLIQADPRSWRERALPSLEWEEYMFLHDSPILFTSPSYFCSTVGYSGTLCSFLGMLYMRFFFTKDVENYISMMQNMQRLIRSQANFSNIVRTLQEREAGLEAQAKHIFSGGVLITMLLMPSLTRVPEMLVFRQIHSNAAELALAVKLYQLRRQGRLPQTLQELVTGGILKSLPQDPIAEKDYQYKIEGKKFRIYSPGLKKWCALPENKDSGLCNSYSSIRHQFIDHTLVWESY